MKSSFTKAGVKEHQWPGQMSSLNTLEMNWNAEYISGSLLDINNALVGEWANPHNHVAQCSGQKSGGYYNIKAKVGTLY